MDKENKDMARPEGPGSHEPSPKGLGPSGFDPSRDDDWVAEAIRKHLEKHPPQPPCEHKFSGWREHSDGLGGEQFCQNCGLGAMAYDLSRDWD